MGGEETRKTRYQEWLPGFGANLLKLKILEGEKLFGRKDDESTSDI